MRTSPSHVPARYGRSTLYRGIRMRSRLEAFTASWLDSIGLAWVYEPDCFADETGQYLPDFCLEAGLQVLGQRRPCYLEVKPAGLTAERVHGLLQAMERIWSSNPEAALLIFSPSEATAVHPPLRLRLPPGVTFGDACWLRCLRCEHVGVETEERMGRPYRVEELWRCFGCGTTAGFDVEVPWASTLWRELVA